MPAHPESDTDNTEIDALVRREFFARAGMLASRYGITPERATAFFAVRAPVAHRTGHGLATARMVANLEDIVHTLACADGHGVAWADLHELHEGALIRLCAGRLGDIAAIMLVRRWFSAMRQMLRPNADVMSVPVGTLVVPVPAIDGYLGTSPLRHWLAQRLLAPVAAMPLRAADDDGGPILRLTPGGDCVPLSLDSRRRGDMQVAT